MFVLKRQTGDVVTMATGERETSISVALLDNDHFILTIDAPPETKLVNSVRGHEIAGTQDEALRTNYRHELLMF